MAVQTRGFGLLHNRNKLNEAAVRENTTPKPPDTIKNGRDKTAWSMGYKHGIDLKPKLSSDKLMNSYGSQEAVSAYLKGYDNAKEQIESEYWHDEQRNKFKR